MGFNSAFTGLKLFSLFYRKVVSKRRGTEWRELGNVKLLHRGGI